MNGRQIETTPEERARQIFEQRTREFKKLHGAFSPEILAALTKEKR